MGPGSVTIPTKSALIDLYVEHHGPSLAARETYWYGGLAPMRVQVDQLVAEARSRFVDIAVSADLATDLVATWRHPTPTVVYAGADRLRNAILAGSLMSVR